MTESQNNTAANTASEEVSGSALSIPKAEVEESKHEVSFNTLLDESNLSFNPD